MKWLEELQPYLYGGGMVQRGDCGCIRYRRDPGKYEAGTQNIAGALGICMEQVSVKATTEEGLGFTGEGKGISAQAVCMLTSPREMATMEASTEVSARSCEDCPGCSAVKH